MARESDGFLDWDNCIHFYDLFISWRSNNGKDTNLHSALHSDYFGPSAYVGTIYCDSINGGDAMEIIDLSGGIVMEELKEMIKEYYKHAKEVMGFDQPARVVLRHNESNAANVLGRTGEYDPAKKKIIVYVTGRHPKDIMRSFSHELVHHTQNCRGDFAEAKMREHGYAQKDKHLREMEREAYEQGNLVFRDWEDGIKYGSKQK